MKREYVEYDKSFGHPAGEDLFYECVKCGGLISSVPMMAYENCPCGNLHREPGRLWTKSGDSGMRLVRISGGKPNKDFKL